MKGIFIFVCTTIILAFAGAFLREHLEAGRWWVLGVWLLGCLYLAWLVGDDFDRHTMINVFGRLVGRKPQPPFERPGGEDRQ